MVPASLAFDEQLAFELRVGAQCSPQGLTSLRSNPILELTTLSPNLWQG